MLPEGAIEFVTKVGEFFFHRLAERISVCEIAKAKDKNIDEALQFYESLFREEHRIAASDLVAWLRAQPKCSDSSPLQHCLLIAKHKNSVVGFFKAIFCPESRYVLISYFGIDKTNTATRRIASKLILRFFKRYIAKKWKTWDGIVFEADLPRIGLTKSENTERKARIRLFRDIAKQQGLYALQLKIDYHQPKMVDEISSTGVGRKMALMVTLRAEPDAETLSRQEVEKLLKFLFLRIYLTTQAMTKANRRQYEAYLVKAYEQTLATLGSDVSLVT